MTRLVWLGWVVIVTSFVGGVVLTGAAAEDGLPDAMAYTVFVFAFATMGALVATRRPHNPIGWILLGAGLAYTLGGISISNHGGVGATATVLAWLSTWVWMAGIAPVATFGLLLFPDGHLPSARWRWLAWLAALGCGLVVSGEALRAGRFADTTIENPIGLELAPAVPMVAEAVGGVLLLVSVVGSIASLFVRYRRARNTERSQLKWLSYTAALVGAALAAAVVIEAVVGAAASELTNGIVTLALSAVPVAMGIAILRHRLYDIDVVIKLTLVYGSLTATLLATYLLMVLLFRLALSPVTGESDLAVAGSTLMVAALFRPARARIQGAVDRRFYRRRYDAARTLESFTHRLRQEVDLESVSADLRAVVRDTVQSANLSLWLRDAR